MIAVMSLTLYSGKAKVNLLLLQLVAILVFGFLAGKVKGVTWAASILAGGGAVWVPAIFFLMFFRKKQMGVSASKIVWQLAIGEAIKIIITGVILLIALGYFNTIVLPVILGYLLVYVVQILAAIMIKTH